MRDTSSFSTLEIKGNDALDFLNRISTNDLKNLKPGESIRTIFCSDKGELSIRFCWYTKGHDYSFLEVLAVRIS
ncbi:MAG: hypothetical protein IPG53_05135 [Ignavibacteriales bacterium]|nr:hypothetical protein [Ignavibacteriales bacterium]